jgi:hypothetical protein
LTFTDFLLNTLPITLLELLAALAIGWYYRYKQGVDRAALWLFRFLLLTVVVELTASYAAIAYFSDYRYFAFVKETPFSNNYWIYNLFILLTVGFYCYYFSSYYRSAAWKRFIGLSVMIYFLICAINLWYSDDFFYQYSPLSFLLGSLLIFLSISLYFVDLLQKDKQVRLLHNLPFYVAVGTLLFYLSLAPLTIYSKYFNSDNSNFVSFQTQVLLITNLLMYLTYFIGALICKKNSSY